MSVQQTLEYYQGEKTKCEAEINNANQQLAVANSNLQRLQEDAKMQFGTDDIEELGNISIKLANELAASEKVLQDLDAGIHH